MLACHVWIANKAPKGMEFGEAAGDRRCILTIHGGILNKTDEPAHTSFYLLFCFVSSNSPAILIDVQLISSTLITLSTIVLEDTIPRQADFTYTRLLIILTLIYCSFRFPVHALLEKGIAPVARFYYLVFGFSLKCDIQ